MRKLNRAQHKRLEEDVFAAEHTGFSMIPEESFPNVTQQSTDGNNEFNGLPLDNSSNLAVSVRKPTNQFVENDNAQCSEERKSDRAIYRVCTVFCDCSRIQESEESGYQTAEPTTSSKKDQSSGLSKLLSSMNLHDEPDANKSPKLFGRKRKDQRVITSKRLKPCSRRERRKKNKFSCIKNLRGRFSSGVQKKRQIERRKSSGRFTESPNDTTVNGSANEYPVTRVDESLTLANVGRYVRSCDPDHLTPKNELRDGTNNNITDHSANNSTLNPTENSIANINNTTPQLASTPKLTNHQVRIENAQCTNRSKPEAILCRKLTCQRCSTPYYWPIDIRNDSVVEQEFEYPTVVESTPSNNYPSSVFSSEGTIQSTMDPHSTCVSEYEKFIRRCKDQGDLLKLCPRCAREDERCSTPYYWPIDIRTDSVVEQKFEYPTVVESTPSNNYPSSVSSSERTTQSTIDPHSTGISEYTEFKRRCKNKTCKTETMIEIPETIIDGTPTPGIEELADTLCDCGFAHLPPINEMTDETDAFLKSDQINNSENVKMEKESPRRSKRLANISNTTTKSSHNNKPQSMRR